MVSPLSIPTPLNTSALWAEVRLTWVPGGRPCYFIPPPPISYVSDLALPAWFAELELYSCPEGWGVGRAGSSKFIWGAELEASIFKSLFLEELKPEASSALMGVSVSPAPKGVWPSLSPLRACWILNRAMVFVSYSPRWEQEKWKLKKKIIQRVLPGLTVKRQKSKGSIII